MACLGSKLYIYGGKLGGASVFNELYQFNTANLVWSLVDQGTGPNGRSNMGFSALSDGTLGLFGGKDGDAVSNQA